MKSIPNLDSVRAFAITSIVFSHASNWVPQMPSAIAFILYAGQFGVELFFALSGYLIGRSFLNEYFKHGSINIAHFMAKRATRIYPPYLVILIVYALGSYFLEGEKFRTEYIFLIQNYLHTMPYFFASWALCIEAHFYIILPFLYLFLDKFIFKLGKPLSIIMVTGVFLIPLVGRTIALQEVTQPIQWGFYYTATHLHYDAIAYGVMAAYISSNKFLILNRLNKTSTFLACILLAVSAVSIHLTTPQIEYVFAPTIVGLLSAVAVLCLAEGPQHKISSNGFIKLLAKISFSIFLAHGIALHIITKGLEYLVFFDSVPLKFTSMIIASLASGLLFYRTVEKPLNSKRDSLLANLFPSRI